MRLCSRSGIVFLSFFAVILAAVPASRADFVLQASCSSQIAKAFGREALESFMAESGVKVRLHVADSEVGLERLKNGFSNLAGVAVRIGSADRDAGLIEIPICRDPLSVIVNAGCKVRNLSGAQVRDIFSGRITNWKDVGGDDRPIVLVIPARTTDAYENFKEQAMRVNDIHQDLVADLAATAVIGVKYIPGSISFISNSIALQHKEVAVVSVDGLRPGAPGYPYWQTFSLVIRGEPDPMLKEVIKYLMSDRAKKKLALRGMTPVFDE